MHGPGEAARLRRTAFPHRPDVAFRVHVFGKDGAFQALLRLRRAQSEAATRTLEGRGVTCALPMSRS
jgi:hypothetical protein